MSVFSDENFSIPLEQNFGERGSDLLGPSEQEKGVRGRRFTGAPDLMELRLDKEFMLLINRSEKRLFKRLEVGLEVELKIEGKPVKATTANISCGGLFLMVDPDHIEKNENLSLVIHLPNRQRPVEVVGEVLRQERSERSGVAIKFQGLYNDNILAIEQFIKSNLH